MRFMVMVRANAQTEAGVPPSPELVAAMGKFNQEMVDAGVMLSGDGLHPTSRGALVRFAGGRHTVVDGPFTESKELIAGFWMLQVASKEEAIAWASRCPGGDGKVDHFGGTFDLEVRQVFELEDFPPEVRAAAGDEAALRERLPKR
jgi:hypothetical protein